MYKAKIILDSISPADCRLTTFEVTYPRIVHAELMTHRMFSRNAASSRAIPVEKMIAAVQEDPFVPVWWGKNQSGMQAAEELVGQERVWAENLWMEARDEAVHKVKQMVGLQSCTGFGTDNRISLHKQIANRLLEPWMWITVIITASDYGNFFAQRCDPMAQPEIQKIAYMMRDLYYANEPAPVGLSYWHMPYVVGFDLVELAKSKMGYSLEDMQAISVARCARVSYLTHSGISDPEADLALYKDKLLKGGHWSPFEHVAYPALDPTIRSGNLIGWHQLRKEYVNEFRYYEYAG